MECSKLAYRSHFEADRNLDIGIEANPGGGSDPYGELALECSSMLSEKAMIVSSDNVGYILLTWDYQLKWKISSAAYGDMFINPYKFSYLLLYYFKFIEEHKTKLGF